MASAELAVVQDTPAPPALLEIDSWTAVATQVIRLAKEIADTPFVPDGLRGSVPATAAAILAGRELGLGPMTSLANIHVIKGKPALSAALMRALILSQGHQIETVDITDTRAVVRGRRKGEAGWEDASFTADQAKRAGIQLGGYPQDKLYARATSRLARRKFADVIAGMPYSAEELEDGETPGEEPAPAPNGHKPETPAPRTARRRTAAAGEAARSQRKGNQAAPHADENGAVVVPAAAGTAPSRDAQPLPPLPGEDEPDAAASAEEPDETDYDTPGTVTTPQITAIWTVLSNVFKFGKDEKDFARSICAHITGRALDSTKNMSKNEAKAVLDTLANWREVAEQHEEKPREFLIELLATAEKAGDGNA